MQHFIEMHSGTSEVLFVLLGYTSLSSRCSCQSLACMQELQSEWTKKVITWTDHAWPKIKLKEQAVTSEPWTSTPALPCFCWMNSCQRKEPMYLTPSSSGYMTGYRTLVKIKVYGRPADQRRSTWSQRTAAPMNKRGGWTHWCSDQ